jgi:uncharacterized RDD family membrane protein YckC
MGNTNDTDNLELASKGKRLLSFIIDDLLITVITIFMLWDSILPLQNDMLGLAMVMNQAFIPIMILKFLYQTFFIWYYGATIGKLITKIKVIDFENFEQISLFSSALRALIRIVSESLFYIGFLLSYYTESRQTLHDKVAKTLVVNA